MSWVLLFRTRLWNLHSDVDFLFFQVCKVSLRKVTQKASTGRVMHLANVALEDKVIEMCENMNW